MIKAIIALSIVGAMGWFAYQELHLGNADVPPAPSVGYMPQPADDQPVRGVGEGVGGVLNP